VKTIAVVVALVLAAGCGRVGDIHPPFIRIPQPVSDLTAQQVAYNAELSWTNPLRYVDGSNATDLATVHVLRNGVRVASVPANAAGQRQSFAMPVADALGLPLTFTIQVETQRGKLSDLSNKSPLLPAEVPGAVRGLTASVDQNQIRLQWQPPERNPYLVGSYIVRRADQPTPHYVDQNHFEDTEFEQNQTYSYTVTAASGARGALPGFSSEPKMVAAIDKTPPGTPTGLHVDSIENRAFLTWEANPENDVAGYRIYRSERTDTGFVQLAQRPITNYVDAAYRPGMYYKITAIDVSGNESEKSEAVAP
jgi:fibronectin type 3 domain-containing protein